MRAMVMAAGLGTRLRPITWEIPKPVVPVGNRPIVEHLVRLAAANGIEEVVANLHWFPDTVRGRLGDGSDYGVEITYRYEEELLGTAGGVRGVADFLRGGDDDTFVVLAGDALTDADLGRLITAHRANDGVATLGVTQVGDVSQYGVVVTSGDGRVEGFQEKPDPAEALSNLCNCMIYAFDGAIFDYFPDRSQLDFANDVFPALLDGDVPFYVHDIDAYWNDIGTLPEYINGNLHAVSGEVAVELGAGSLCVDGARPEGIEVPDDVEIEGPILFGEGVEIGAGASLVGPMVIGPRTKVGAGARIKQAVLLPGAEVAAGSVLARGIAGDAARLAADEW